MADEEKGFHEMGLDDRILKALSKLGWSKPTPIQERAIPLALEGKDILARAKTGSGKTAAYVTPIIQRLLQEKQSGSVSGVFAAVLVPTKELAQQACNNIKEISMYCSRDIRVVDLAMGNLEVLRPLVMEGPDVIVGTPTKVLAHIQAKNLELKDSLQILVVDEADLVFSYGYEDDLKELLRHFPKIFQSLLMSATLTEDVESLKKLVLHNPVILKLQESELPEKDRLTQYLIKCEPDDKFLLIYTLLKLRLVQGKTLLFVNGIDRCYRLKLFLEQFSIKSCVVNSELPQNSRCHILEEFNKGLYDYVIASDETIFDNEPAGSKKKSSKKKSNKDKEYGVSRGIDFQGVENVINFDFPATVDTYIHRVGRTARGENVGTALSFITASDNKTLSEAKKRLESDAGCSDDVFKPYQFKMEEIEGFRYRAKDALRSVTKSTIKEARLKEIREEILNSEKLKSHFEDNPRDLQVLRHDKNLHPSRIQPHLKNIPEYLVPKTLKGNVQTSRKRQHHFQQHRGASKHKKTKIDPLRSFTFSREQGVKQKRRKPHKK